MVANFLGAMAWVMIVVGALSLASTMGLAVLERTREIGVLRAIGARHRSIFAIVQAEGLLVALLSWLAAIPAAAGLHALTAGAMGTTILAVITRVGLGHTGRALVLPRGVVWSYALVQVAAIARVAASFLPADAQRALLVLSGVAWAAAFGLYAVWYWPILTSPRPDGRPG